MNVLPVTSYSCRYPAYNRQRATHPNFKGGAGTTAIDLLKQPATTVKVANDLTGFMSVARELKQRYLQQNKFIGTMMIPEQELQKFIGEKACQKHDLKDKVGMCIAITDVKDPDFRNASERIALIMPKKCFGVMGSSIDYSLTKQRI